MMRQDISPVHNEDIGTVPAPSVDVDLNIFYFLYALIKTYLNIFFCIIKKSALFQFIIF